MEKNNIYFYTCSILNWQKVLISHEIKQIILDSLTFLIKDQSIKVFGYVIMPNHIHLIWMPLKDNVQLRFMKFTAQQLKFYLKKHKPQLLEKLMVNSKDRVYQIWQRNPQAKELKGRKMLEQKLDYLHNNPCQGKWMLIDNPILYHYSSIRFYEFDESSELLTHYMEYI